MALKSYVSEFTIHCGPATVRGKLVPVRMPDRKPQLHYCTPDGEPVKQVYRAPDGQFYDREELSRATVDDDGNLTQVDPYAVAEAKTSSLPLNTIALSVHDPDDVGHYLFPSNNNAYIFQPVIKKNKKIIEDPVNQQWHDFLNVVIRESGCVFLGMCNLRNFEGLFRVSHYQGYMTIQKQLFPEDLNQFEVINPDLPAVEKAKALAVARAMVTPFNPDDYKDEASERLIQALEKDFDPTALPVVDSKTMKPEGIDLSSALDAFLNQ